MALARAILAAAGNTGHLVVSVEDSSRAIRIRDALAAEGMRERAAFVVRQRDHSGRGAEEYGITADTTDERLDEIEEEIRENLKGISDSDEVVLEGVWEHLVQLRDDADE